MVERNWRLAKAEVREDGIYIPTQEYTYEGVETKFQCLLTREIFQEAYKKYILNTMESDINV